MLDQVGPKLKTGLRVFSETVRANARESEIGTQLGGIAKANPGVAIGSHPFFDPQHGPNTNVVLRASDRAKAPARQARGGGPADGSGCAIEPRLRAAAWHRRGRGAAGDGVLCAAGLRLRAGQRRSLHPA